MKPTDWTELIYRGIETQTLDYKAAQNWLTLPRAGKAKFVRHALALANTNGGHIVIGVGEDPSGNPTLFQGLNPAQLKSFDPSIVAQFINLYADPAIDLDVVRPEIDGKSYAILVIRPFKNLPHVCTNHHSQELQQGVFYIRTPDARSRAAYRASELQQLIQRALRNQRQALGRMLRGVLYEGRQYAETNAEQEFQREHIQSQTDYRQWIGQKNLNHNCTLEITAYPATYHPDDRMLTDLSGALHQITHPSDNPFIVNTNDHELFFTNQSLLGQRKTSHHFQYIQLFRSGHLHSARSLTNTNTDPQLAYPDLARYIATQLRMLSEYYTNLGLDDQLLTITLTIKSALNLQLTQTDEPQPTHFQCRIPDIEIKKRRTVADLSVDVLPHAEKIIKQICERFNYDASHHPKLRPLLQQILR